MAKDAIGGRSIPPSKPGPYEVIISPEAQAHISRLPYGWALALRPAWENLEHKPTTGRGKREIAPSKVPSLKVYPGERLFHYVWGELAIWYAVFADPDVRVVYVLRVQPFIF